MTTLRARCESTPALLAKGPGFVLYAVMDFIVDQYFPVVEQLEEAFEALEEQIFTECSSRDTTRSIYSLKRELVAVKRTIMPLVEVCNRLMKFDLDLVPHEIHPYFRDVHDHLLRVVGQVQEFRELLMSVLTANLTQTTVRQNEDVRKISAWAAIVAVPTMIAGIYGMNFEYMPELEWRLGYPLVLAVIGVACVTLYRLFRRAGWL